MNNFFKLTLPFLVISACTNADSLTHSDFQTPSNIGYLGATLTSAVRGDSINATGDGYAYAVGEGTDQNFYGYAGIVPTTSVVAPPVAGTATWVGTYSLARITGIEYSTNGLQGYTTSEAGALSLTADFAAGTLAGSGVGGLTISGTFVGSNLSGGVTYQGLAGSLTGQVGATGAVGAFHGNGATDLYAGGFLVGAP